MRWIICIIRRISVFLDTKAYFTECMIIERLFKSVTIICHDITFFAPTASPHTFPQESETHDITRRTEWCKDLVCVGGRPKAPGKHTLGPKMFWANMATETPTWFFDYVAVCPDAAVWPRKVSWLGRPSQRSAYYYSYHNDIRYMLSLLSSFFLLLSETALPVPSAWGG